VTHRIDAIAASGLAARILQAIGAPEDVAVSVADWLVSSDLSGHPSHGIIRVHDYASRAAKGTLDPRGRPELLDTGRDAVVLVDAHHGFGHPAAARLVDELATRVGAHGVALGGVIDVSHTGRLGEWSERAARNGVGLFMCYASLDKTNVAAYGAREARLGTNPVTAGVPSPDGRDLILDFATSGLAGGKMQHYMETGAPVPPGFLLDAEGRPTSDPHAFVEGGMLLTFGAHKGYGLSLLASVLAGSVVGERSGDHTHGLFAIAFDVGAFAGQAAAVANIGRQLERMRSTPPGEGFARVEVPGDHERSSRERLGGVLELPDDGWRHLTELAEQLGVGL
jgi:LDH2 family malate/lactate/ureidoglycolate dehydrogenase